MSARNSRGNRSPEVEVTPEVETMVEAEATPEVEAEAKLPDPNELVTYTAPFIPGSKTQKPVVAIVNGEMIRIKRGETVKIKRKFLEVLDNANAQTLAMYKAINDVKKAGEKPAAEM